MKDRHRKRIRTEVVRRTDKATLQSFINSFVIGPGAAIYTNKASAYEGLPNHEDVKHSTGEYVRRMAHNGTFHRMSPKHLNRYVTEFEGRYNIREQDTADQLTMEAQRMVGKRLRYRDLIAPNGLDSAARSASFAGPKPASSLHFLQQKTRDASTVAAESAFGAGAFGNVRITDLTRPYSLPRTMASFWERPTGYQEARRNDAHVVPVPRRARPSLRCSQVPPTVWLPRRPTRRTHHSDWAKWASTNVCGDSRPEGWTRDGFSCIRAKGHALHASPRSGPPRNAPSHDGTPSRSTIGWQPERPTPAAP